jgi:hypothetical protein
MDMAKQLVVPILIILIGTAWLLNVLDVHWLWPIGLAAAGIVTMAKGGINRRSVVIGPVLIAVAVCSVLRQTHRLPADQEVPILTIVLGVLLLLARLLRLPSPKAMEPDKKPEG